MSYIAAQGFFVEKVAVGGKCPFYVGAIVINITLVRQPSVRRALAFARTLAGFHPPNVTTLNAITGIGVVIL